MLQKTESEVVKNWVTARSRPVVTIACLTYNHEDYISQALDSFLMQETTFPFEIIINDDASTDQNPSIINNYAEKYPSIIKPIFHEKNQYSISKRVSIDFIFGEAKGDYIAFCEGDDYWTDTTKLQKQYTILENNRQLNMCLHFASLLDQTTQKIIGEIGRYPVDLSYPVISFAEVVTKKYGQIPTASTFIRATVLKDLEEFFKISNATIFDIFLHMIAARGAGAYLIEEAMSVYRVNVPGSWNDSTTMGKLDSHVFKRAEAFRVLEKFVEPSDIGVLKDAVYSSYLFILKLPNASRYTKLKVLETIEHTLPLNQKVYFRFLAEFNVIHRAWFKGQRFFVKFLSTGLFSK